MIVIFNKHWLFKRFVISIVILMSLLILVSCNTSNKTSNTQESNIEIALIYPFSIDKEVKLRHGIELAVAEINQNQGINGKKLVLRLFDDKGTVTGGIQAANQVLNTHAIKAVIGHFNSRIAKNTIPLFHKEKMCFVSPAVTSPYLFKEKQNYIFRTIPNDKAVMEKIYQHLERKGIERIAVFYADDEFGRGVVQSLEDLSRKSNVKIIDRISHLNNENINQCLNRWEALDAQVVLIAEVFDKAKDVVQTIHQKRSDLLLIGTSAFDFSEAFQLFGNNEVNIIIPTHFMLNKKNSQSMHFHEHFIKTYGSEPDLFSATGYDTVYIIAQALKNSKDLSSDQIAEQISKTYNFQGATGIISCQKNGEFTGNNIYLKSIRKGQLIQLDLDEESGL